MKLELNPKTKKYERFKDPTKLIGDAVLRGITSAAPKGWLYHMKVKGIEGQAMIQQDPQTGLKAIYVKGVGILRKHRTSDDRLFQDKETSFEIEFKEDFDELGLPDIKVVKFNFKDVEV